jgi:hypothetical protein
MLSLICSFNVSNPVGECKRSWTANHPTDGTCGAAEYPYLLNHLSKRQTCDSATGIGPFSAMLSMKIFQRFYDIRDLKCG